MPTLETLGCLMPTGQNAVDADLPPLTEAGRHFETADEAGPAEKQPVECDAAAGSHKPHP